MKDNYTVCIRKICCLLVFVFVPSAYAQTEQRHNKFGHQWNKECEKDQLAMNYCAYFAFKKIDSELNRLYEEQISYLTLENYKKALKESQRAWLNFRDQDCLYQRGSESERGSMDEYIKFSCMYTHTERRVEDLKEYVSCRENGCPY